MPCVVQVFPVFLSFGPRPRCCLPLCLPPSPVLPFQKRLRWDRISSPSASLGSRSGLLSSRVSGSPAWAALTSETDLSLPHACSSGLSQPSARSPSPQAGGGLQEERKGRAGVTPVGVELLSDWLCSSLSLPLLLLQVFQLCSSYFIFRAKTNITSNLFLLCLPLTERSFRNTLIRRAELF